MKKSAKLILVSLIAICSKPLFAETIDLTGLGYVQYGDARTYSLPVANYQHGLNLGNGAYAVPSSPGQIGSLIVIATGSNGNPVITNFSGMDNAYSTPSGNKGSTFFDARPSNSNGTTGTVANDNPNAWDASLLAMKGFLAGDGMVFFLNDNQKNNGASSNQSLAAWARVWVTNASNNIVGDSFYLTNNHGAYNLVSSGGGGTFMGDVASYTGSGTDPFHAGANQTDYVLAGGEICVAHNGNPDTPPVPVDCKISASGLAGLGLAGWTVSSKINHNLGADHAAYAITFPELDQELATLFSSLSETDLGNYTLHVDVRLGCELDRGPSFSCGDYNGWGTGLNSGFEQVFIGRGNALVINPGSSNETPEPGTLALLGAVLLGTVARRQYQALKA